jgi:hypothetical protein
MYADEDIYLFPTYDRQTSESVVPVAAFLGKRIIGLKKSFVTSDDADERDEIIAMLIFHQSALLLLTMSFLTEETELTDLAKENFRK